MSKMKLGELKVSEFRSTIYMNLSSLIVTIVLIFSCQPSDLKINADLVDYDQIGREHNQGLDAIFESLKSLKTSGRLSNARSGEFLDVIENVTIDFTLKNHSDLSGSSVDELKRNVAHMKSNLNEYSSLAARTNDSQYIHDKMISEIEHLLTANQKSYVSKIIEAVTSIGLDINAIQAKLKNIESEVRLKCSEEELPVLLSTLSIARHSSQYWHDNYSKWVEEFGDLSGSGRVKAEINWWVVGGADVAAGVSVGVATSTALVVPFIGWTAWGIVTGGAALITSGASAAIYAIS